MNNLLLEVRVHVATFNYPILYSFMTFLANLIGIHNMGIIIFPPFAGRY